MKRLFLLSLLSLVLCTPALAGRRHGTAARHGAAPRPAAVPRGMVLVPIEALDRFVEDVSEEIHGAYGKFLAGNYVEAAEDLETVAAYLVLEVARSKGREQVALQEARDEMRNTAKAVRRFSPPTSDEVERVFANAEFALARHHLAKAEDFEKAGLELQSDLAQLASITHLLQCLGWADIRLDPKELAELRQRRSLGQKALHGAGRLPRGFVSGLKGLQRSMGKVGKSVGRRVRIDRQGPTEEN